MSWGGSEIKPLVSTRRFDQYALIIFWRKNGCIMSTKDSGSHLMLVHSTLTKEQTKSV